MLAKKTAFNFMKRCQPLLGTYVEVSVLASGSDNTRLDISNVAFSEIKRIENLMSFHNPDSELSYINREAYRHPCAISKEMEEVLSTAIYLSRVTAGLYDISIAPQLVEHDLLPNQGLKIDEDASWKDISLSDGHVLFNKKMLLDLGGIAKGYAVDCGFSLVKENVEDITINAGGDLRRKKWEGEVVSIKAIGKKGKKILVDVPMQNTALATSASYYIKNGVSAIVSPLTKKLIKDKRSISVFASNCMLADALTKIVFLNSSTSVINSLGAKVIAIEDNSVNKLYKVGLW